ncbi:MAG: DNA repair protein RecN [Bacteroidales bacterium]|jgi:DNA repair protein RecN (Recombination protein N)|nr:DNA repair protein RecN [Bacteroidales bacterium]
MLQKLSISNYALIEALNISFGNGFTVITGETGAGKSILLGALGLVLGKRADVGVLFNKDEKCIVELTFQLENDSLKPLFESWDLEYDRECLMRREISPKGKSRAFINDTPVNLQQMKTLGSQLIDVHSQHDSLLLVDQNYQLKMLDTLIDDQSVIEDYKLHYQTYIKLKQEIEKLKSELSSNLAEMDFLRFQLNEIEAANLVANEFEELQQRLLMLDHAEEIKTSLVEINSILQQGEQPIISELTQLKRQLEKLRKYLPQATSLDERLDTVLIELKDISFETDQLEADVQFDPDELEQASARMDLINHLMHKHHLKSFDQLLKLKTELAERLSNIDSSEDILAQKTKLFDTNFLKLKALATTIHKQRLAAAQPFQQSVSGLLKQLGMPFGSFKIDCTPTASITDLGMSRVRFLFSANKGIAEAEIDKVASGGELSRLMLAIKWMIAGAGFVSTVIFDEIDTGVSGEVAARVARLLRQMSGKVQLINITHLPQIASKADAHFFVFKEESKERSFTNMRLLDLDERYEEVAKMISNDAVSEVALQAAKSLFEVN